MARLPLMSWCARGWRRGSRDRHFMSSWSSQRRSRSAAKHCSGCGAAASFSRSGTPATKARTAALAPFPAMIGIRRDDSLQWDPTDMTRHRLIERLTDRPPGRRGFGGTDDANEAAEFRRVLRGDHDLNPGMSAPSAALRPAAVLVPLVDHAHGMSVLLTQRTAHLSAHAGQISRSEERRV